MLVEHTQELENEFVWGEVDLHFAKSALLVVVPLFYLNFVQLGKDI